MNIVAWCYCLVCSLISIAAQPENWIFCHAYSKAATTSAGILDLILCLQHPLNRDRDASKNVQLCFHSQHFKKAANVLSRWAKSKHGVFQHTTDLSTRESSSAYPLSRTLRKLEVSKLWLGKPQCWLCVTCLVPLSVLRVPGPTSAVAKCEALWFGPQRETLCCATVAFCWATHHSGQTA